MAVKPWASYGLVSRSSTGEQQTTYCWHLYRPKPCRIARDRLACPDKRGHGIVVLRPARVVFLRRYGEARAIWSEVAGLELDVLCRREAGHRERYSPLEVEARVSQEDHMRPEPYGHK